MKVLTFDATAKTNSQIEGDILKKWAENRDADLTINSENSLKEVCSYLLNQDENREAERLEIQIKTPEFITDATNLAKLACIGRVCNIGVYGEFEKLNCDEYHKISLINNSNLAIN